MEQILPGVSIAVRPEGLIIPGVVTISTIGMVGTASKGPIDEPVIIGSPAEAREVFGEADEFIPPGGSELTLIRALDLAYNHGARDVIAVRVASSVVGATQAANFMIASAGGDCCLLTAASPGSWANDLELNIVAADEGALISDEEHGGAAVINLEHTTLQVSVRNRVSVLPVGSSTPNLPTVVHDTGGPPGAGEVDIDTATGTVTFAAGEAPAAGDQVFVTYIVPAANSCKVTLRDGISEEVFTAASGAHLADLVSAEFGGSELVTGTGLANAGEVPGFFGDLGIFASGDPNAFLKFGTGANDVGINGASDADYDAGLIVLSNEPAFVIVAAGQTSDAIRAQLTAHVNTASSDSNKRERIGVIGSGLDDDLDTILEHTLNSDRVVFVAPGIKVADPVSNQLVTLSGGYAAAAVAGMISGFPVHRSLTNKVLSIAGLEEVYTQAQLRRLIQARVLALELKLGFRTVKGITTSTNTAWHQITTRRIVDKAKFGVRSAANPYIGLLNNERVRAAMRSTINAFLSEMVVDEELVSYELEVSATRDDERRGIARVTMILRPTFSIDFIKVTMFLE